MDLLAYAQKSLAGKAWSCELVIRMGVELLCVAQTLPNLSFQDKSSLVCQTILKMLDGVETVGKEHAAESTGIVPTKAQLDEYRNLVKNVLPVCLDIVNKSLAPAAACLPLASCLPMLPSLSNLSFGCMRKQVADAVSMVEDSLKHPQEYLEEMRGLVLRMEGLLSSANVPSSSASVPVPEPVPSGLALAAESLLEPRSQLPPTPVSTVEQLPGAPATPEGVVLSQ